MRFIYSFDMSLEIPHFNRFPEDVQISAECNSVDVIYESFVVTGDQDYLMSRLLAQHGLPRGFFWAAAQAIEKYLKAFLLMNGVSVKEESNNHSLKVLFNKASKQDSSIADLQILPHHSIQVDTDLVSLLETFSVINFIDELEKHGSPSNRYNTMGIQYNTGHLLAMDSLSFQLRSKIGAIAISESFKRLSPELVETFVKNNPWFETEGAPFPNRIPSKEFPLHLTDHVTKLEILRKNENNPAYSLALKWLEGKMKLPKAKT